MSTKTTIKRIALVAVAALGLGSVSALSANATATYTAGLTFSTSSLTVVGGGTDNTNSGIIKVAATNDAGDAHALYNGETITVQVVAVPTTVDSTYNLAANKGDINYAGVTTTSDANEAAGTYTNTNGTTAVTNGGAMAITNAQTAFSNHAAVDGSTANVNSVYGIAFYPDSAAVDHGYYTIRIRLTDVNGLSTDKLVKVAFVTSAADSGAVITNTVSGNMIASSAIAYTSTQKITTTLRDANGGLIQKAAASATAYKIGAPAITAQIISSTNAVLDTLSAKDTGVAAEDHVASTTSSIEAENVVLNALNGNYGVTSSGNIAATASLTTSLRVIYGATSVVTSLPIVAAGATYAASSVSATGKLAASGTGSSATVDASGTNYIVPLSTKSATISATLYDDASKTNVMTGSAVYYTLSYTGCVAADLSPAKVSTPAKLTSDSVGAVSVTVANAVPVDGCYATVVFSNVAGATTGSTLTRVVSWQKSVPTTVSTVPGGNIKAALKAANKVTWTVVDQFSNPVAGAAVQFSMSGANAPTAGLASSTTDANGSVSYSWTDALAVDADTDTVAIAKVGDTALAAGSITITYKATMPTVATLSATYGSSATVVPSTNIGGTAGIAVSAADALDLTKNLSGSTSSSAPWVKLNFTAKDATATAVTGVPTTVTVTGAQLVGADGKLATSKVVYDNSDVYVLGTKTGVATVTAVNGSLTKTATILFVNAASDARVITATASGNSATFTVTDAFGNGVEGVVLNVTATGASLGNGGNYAQFSTAADGTAVVTPNGSGTLTAKIDAAAASAKWDNLAGYSDATGTNAVTGAPAGVRSASVEVTGTASSDSVDAANEATDAANAATDAANAAAEAADAATAAAQDAQAAVAALATSVASLIAGIKAQITTLTNLVIKIQKKVRA
jgi:hypothetical protein